MTDKSETAQPSGLPYALSAYLIWGFVPVYFKLLSHVSPIAVVAQRVLWSIPLLLVIMAFRKQLGEYAAIFRHKAARLEEAAIAKRQAAVASLELAKATLKQAQASGERAAGFLAALVASLKDVAL